MQEVGLDLMTAWAGQAGFLSANGYHHHIALNTFQSKGGRAPDPSQTGLHHFAINYPNCESLVEATRRVLDHKHDVDGVEERADRAVDGDQRPGEVVRHRVAGAGRHPRPRGDHTGRGQLDPARRARQQGDAKGGLERLDLLADRLLGDVQLLGGPGEATQLRHGHKATQLP